MTAVSASLASGSMPKYSGARSPDTHCWWWPITSTGTVDAAAPASSQSICSLVRCPELCLGTAVSRRATATPGSSIHSSPA